MEDDFSCSSNDANSIIIDTKINNNGIPVLAPDQMDEYLKRALGEEYDAIKLAGSSNGGMNSQGKLGIDNNISG